ncbi:Major facilitator superfamily [Kalmanozyma brasiliensis GHG001]|uniref:Major facilitator superfamily (MFS) profile domain-containing protein n=1 Tax=Kalmanozyma brasiliensis (strain GHG001) TaxID=1365824 RepID=V5ERK2_KALBG|nr:Major facilitator superfamily [Kalmanozyma brasiliensis GHG001]EST04504.1 Major facilitator superfamily [Kalmanozyma brasiliensis GHG001]
MVLKATSIHTNFLSSGEQYTTDDASSSATPAQTQDDAQVAPSRPTQSRKNSLWSRKSREQPRKEAAVPEGAKDDNIILVVWDGDQDPENPMNWSIGRKWLTTALLCSMCLFIGLATAAFSVGIGPMAQELGVSNEVGQVGMLLFNGAFSIVPLFLGPLSEFVGRNPIYLGCYALFTVWFIPLALAKNIQTVLVARFLSGAFGAAGTTIIPGTLADIWKTRDRGLPVALFSLVAVAGTVGAPLYCGYILQEKGWRWIQWVQLIVNGAVVILEFLLLRETRGSVILARRAQRLRKETGDQRYRAPSELEAPSLKALLHASTTRAALLLVSEPVVFCFSLYIAYAWALIFAFFAAIPIVFQEIHGWGVGNGGLAYIGPLIACFLAFGLSFHGKYLYDRAQARNGGVAVPEARLYYAAVGGILATIGMFIFAFTSYQHVHWIAPEIALVPLVMGIYQIFEAIQNYLADAYGSEYGASAISAQGFVRNALAASFPLFSTQMFHNLTVPYAGLLLACLLALAVPLPFVLIKYGAQIRARSKYAASDDTEDGGPVIGARRGDVENKVGMSNSMSSVDTTRVHTPIKGMEDAEKAGAKGEKVETADGQA